MDNVEMPRKFSGMDGKPSPYLMLMKKHSKENTMNSSILLWERGSNKRISFTLKNETEFFQKENLDNNLKKIYSKINSEEDLSLLKNKVADIEKLFNAKVNTVGTMKELNNVKTGNDENSRLKLLNDKEDAFSNANNNYLVIGNVLKLKNNLISRSNVKDENKKFNSK